MPPDVTTTGAGTTGRMQRFVTALLIAEGALIEPVESDALEVLSPPNVQTALNLREVDRLGFGATPSPGVRRVGLEGDWLDRFGRLLGERGRSTRRVLAGEPRRPGSPERMLEQQLVLDNATYRLLDVAPAWTRYLVLDFRFSATSDEKRDGLLRLGINLATGALPDTVLERVLPELDAQATDPELPHDAVLPPSWDASRLQDLVARAVPSRLDVALASFVKGLRRRFERDRERLYSYHNELYREASGRTAGLPAEDPARKRDALRAEAAGREYRATLDDLTRQYATSVEVAWVQTLELVMPVQRMAVQIRRRKAERLVHLDWNPLARQLEGPACEATGGTERPRLVCDEALHLVSTAGLAPCPTCGKPFCRACHLIGRCPKCGVRDTPRIAPAR